MSELHFAAPNLRDLWQNSRSESAGIRCARNTRRLVVPYSLTHNDGKYAGSVGTSGEWFAFVRDGFDTLYAEGATAPKMMSVGLHMRLIGHPARAAGLARLLDHIGKHEGVWVARRIDIAGHWLAHHPFPGRGLNEQDSLIKRLSCGARDEVEPADP
ncbi:hypothetical protein SAMN02745194_02146 [Roseomonas rosea]|uniref:Polysaccharide deacetylase n=1 Tax=Muricoccus roseus TaxID=198092 RepID=A0A1M6HZM8_9PROT|nr:hypothetical protein [Roseomonas rosea]SHJ27637.1 hypothetical protein SAMN02745194_02146 [Roseomonas rosea]